jgi:hypothetical protein
LLNTHDVSIANIELFNALEILKNGKPNGCLKKLKDYNHTIEKRKKIYYEKINEKEKEKIDRAIIVRLNKKVPFSVYSYENEEDEKEYDMYMDNAYDSIEELDKIKKKFEEVAGVIEKHRKDHENEMKNIESSDCDEKKKIELIKNCQSTFFNSTLEFIKKVKHKVYISHSLLNLNLNDL